MFKDAWMVGRGYSTFINFTGREAAQSVLPVCVFFNFAKMFLRHRFEYVDHRFRIGQPDLRRRVVGVQRGIALAVAGRGAVLGDEIHQAGDAHVALRGGAEQRDEMLLLHRSVDAGAKFLLRQPALVEKFRQQVVIRLRDVLDQFPVELRDLFLPFARGRFLAEFAPGVGQIIRHHLIAQDIQNLVEARPGIDRQVQRKNPRPVMLPRRRQHFVEARVDLVHRVDHDDFGNAQFRRVIPDPLRAHADAVLGMHRHQGQIRHPQRAQRLPHKVQVARRVNHIELLPHPFRVQQRRLRRNLPLLFAGVVVRDRRSVGDAAHPTDGPAAHQHRFTQHGFPARGVADNGKIPKIRRSIFLHGRQCNARPRRLKGKSLASVRVVLAVQGRAGLGRSGGSTLFRRKTLAVFQPAARIGLWFCYRWWSGS